MNHLRKGQLSSLHAHERSNFEEEKRGRRVRRVRREDSSAIT
jgi:hypothetical protein